MGVNWAVARIRWKPHVARDGKVYSLAHLYPFAFRIQFDACGDRPARTVTVNAGFSLHTFTCAIADAGSEAELYGDNRETRAFDYERYTLSHRLREIIEGLERRKCFFAGRLNYFTYDLVNIPAHREYRVFFDVQRQGTNTVELVVQTAFVVKGEEVVTGRRLHRAQFRVIVSEALDGRKPKEPP